MNLLLSDTPLPTLPSRQENHYIDLTELNITNCIGCFGCWTKTPGRCVIRDDAVKVYPLIAKSRRLLYVSHVCFGSYDITMKTMLERAIPTQQAFLRIYNNETHHVQRRVVLKDAVILAYGAGSDEEKRIFRQLVSRNTSNMLFQNVRIRFVDKNELADAITEEVTAWEKC